MQLLQILSNAIGVLMLLKLTYVITLLPMQNKAQNAAEDAGDSIKKNFNKATDAAQDAGKDVQRKAEDVGDSARDTARDVKRDAEKGADRISN